MAFSAVPTKVLGDSAPASDWNTYVRDNFTAYTTHDHGSSNDGGQSLGVSGGLVKERFTDAAAPSAPGAGKTEIYSTSGKIHQRAGVGGSDEELSVVGHPHVFGVDVELADVTNHDTSGSQKTVNNDSPSDADVIETSTDTYASNVEVAIHGGMLAAQNGEAGASVELFFDGVELQQSATFSDGVGVYTFKALSDSVSITTGASKIAKLIWDTGGSTLLYAASFLTVTSFSRT